MRVRDGDFSVGDAIGMGSGLVGSIFGASLCSPLGPAAMIACGYMGSTLAEKTALYIAKNLGVNTDKELLTAESIKAQINNLNSANTSASISDFVYGG